MVGKYALWDHGPYPVLDGFVQEIGLNDAQRVIREQKIDCIYSLFQEYDPRALLSTTSPACSAFCRSIGSEPGRGRVGCLDRASEVPRQRLALSRVYVERKPAKTVWKPGE
jgi:hypothetical protein